VSSEGSYAYVGNGNGTSALFAAFRRDAATGDLGHVESWGVESGLVDTAQAVASVADGAHVYEVGANGGVRVFEHRQVCSAAPMTGCDIATAAGLKIFEGNGKPDLLAWKWVGAGPIVFGDPLADTDVSLCVYDASGGSQPVLGTIAPRENPFAIRATWRTTKAGFKYIDKPADPDGLTKAKIVLGATGRAKLVVRGKSITLPPLGLPYVAPVTAQVQASSGGCWEALFPTPVLNDSTRFRAR
jgi:hypothetical protein